MIPFDFFKDAYKYTYIIYLRKSRKDGDESVEDVLSRHYEMLQSWSERTLGYRIAEDNIYREVVSGETIADRPEMQKMLSRCECDSVRGIIAVEPQRLTRGDYGEIDRVVKTLQYSNTVVCTPSYTFDLNDKRDKKSFESELIRGADYLDYIKDILMRGRTQSVSEGKFVGSIVPFGYDKVKLHKGFSLQPNADAEAVKIVFDMYSKGDGLWTIANRLNALGFKPKKSDIWKAYNVKQMLSMEVYIGLICYDKHITVPKMVDGEVVKKVINNPNPTFYKGLHQPIVDEVVFQSVQEKLKRNSSKCVTKSKELRNPLSGLVRCKHHPNEIARRKGGSDSLVCDCKLYGCSNIFTYIKDVEKALLEEMKKDLANFNYILDNYGDSMAEHKQDTSKQLALIDANLSKYKRGIRTAQRKYNDGEYTSEEFYDLKADYEADIANCEAERDKLLEEDETAEYDHITRLIPRMDKVLDNYWNLSNSQKNELLKTMIDRVLYAKDEKGRDKPISLEITYKF